MKVCPWSRLKWAGRCPWRASRHLRPSHLDPGDLLDHMAHDHRSEEAQRQHAEALVTGVMPRRRIGPAAATARPVPLAQPSGEQPSGA